MEINSAIVVCLLCGLIYLILGWAMKKFPPKKINDYYGYRTRRSKISQKHWDFAQKESVKHIIQAGYYSILCSSLFILFPFEESHVWIAVTITTLLPLISVIQTEKALKKKFES